MIPLYLSEGEAENIRGDIAFAQSCLETGNFTFSGSAVKIPGSGSPSLALRVLLYSKVFHIWGTATGYKVKAWVNAVLLQLRGIGVCLEVL